MTRKRAVKLAYRVHTVGDAKKIGREYLQSLGLDKDISFGLPEIDDRFDIWRLPLKSTGGSAIGEIVLDAITSLVDISKTTAKELLVSRLSTSTEQKNPARDKETPVISTLKNIIRIGDSEELLRELPENSVDLVFTSPPYYNAKPEYAEYQAYDEYLQKMQRIIHECGRVLNEGRFFVINVSPVLIRRSSRNEASRRIAVPFDFHRLFMEEGFEFIDDIIWVKPEGAGWATGRGRRFAADRHPLQYKPVPVTEYVLVYRKKSDRLIDWLIRKHPDQDAVRESRIGDGYDVTNVWKITPAHSKSHPAVFPMDLAKKVIRYYSFKNDVVLDPFAGTGTTARAAVELGRRYVAFERNEKYVDIIKQELECKTRSLFTI